MIVGRASALVLLALGVSAGGASARVLGFTPPALQGPPKFLVSGHGWGHGVGMSQYGAYGFAQNGFTYDQILGHYYPGTELGTSTVNRIRVLLANTPSVTISSLGPVKLKDGTGVTTTLDAGRWTLGPTLMLSTPTSTTPQQLTGPLTFTATTLPLYFKRPYRGAFTVTTDGTKLTLVDTIPLEQYLYGVVPSEMPSTWSDEALKAQAVAARSYAIAVRKTAGPFDVYADTRSQVYGGVLAENPATTAAVDETKSEVLLYDGNVAVTYFYSTSGGRTAAISDVWTSEPVPYLVSVDDPYDAISPYHDWGPLSFTAAAVKSALKLPGRVVDLQTTLNASGRVSAVDVATDQGDVLVAGSALQTALKLRSTWFRVGVLALDPLPSTTVGYGSALALTGIGRGLSDLQLEKQRYGETTWTAVGPVTPDPDGSISIPFKAAAPVSYRLTSSGVSTAPAKLIVAPSVRLAVPTAAALSGTVRPLLPGVAVQVQRQNADGTWAIVAKSTVDTSGSFSAAFKVAPGTFRARVFAGHGWAVGLSPPLQVGGA